MATNPPRPARAASPKTHLAGEFFVAAELAKRGYEVSVTMGNAKAVDLFAERDGETVQVQVKAIARRSHTGWPLSTDKMKIRPGIIWVCVVLNDIGEPPSYFVVRAEEVAKFGGFYATRAILDVSALQNAKRQDAWHLIEASMQRRRRASD